MPTENQDQETPPEREPLRFPIPPSPWFADPLHPTEEERARVQWALQHDLMRTTTVNTPGSSRPRRRRNTFRDARLQKAIDRKNERFDSLCDATHDQRRINYASFAPYQEDEAERVRSRLRELLRDIPPRCLQFTLDTYPDPTAAAYRAVRHMLDVWNEQRGLLLVGDCGVGKTGLMVGVFREIARRWAEDGSTHGMRFITGPDLMDFLRNGYDNGSHEDRLNELRNVRLLAIDDLGVAKPSDWVMEQLFALINHRYDHELPTFATTNYGLAELGDRIGVRALERLLETSAVITVQGRNLRSRGR